jgi:hypothetical protein
MKISRLEMLVGVVALIVCFTVALSGRAQAPNTTKTTTAAASPAATTPATMDAQREQIWNSPNMLRARAWLQDYCSKSAKVTPEEAKTYMAELQNLTPTQMKLWLLKFDEQEEARQQQTAFWQQAHAASMSRAVQANQNTQKAYASITQGETAAATEAQQQINEEQQFQQNEAMNNQSQAAPIGPYGPGGYFPIYGGVHYHMH